MHCVSLRYLQPTQLHGGTPYKDPATNAKSVPIYQTASFVFDTAAQGAALFDTSSVSGNSNIYSYVAFVPI